MTAGLADQSFVIQFNIFKNYFVPTNKASTMKSIKNNKF